MKKIYVCIMAGFLALATALCCFGEKQSFSESERRQLADFPQLSVKTIASGKFMSEFENYAQDQFPFRDSMRGLKSFAVLKLFNQQDNNGLFLYHGHIIKQDYPINYDMLENAASKLGKIYDSYLKDSDCQVYFSIVPDKNNFVPASKGMLKADFDSIEEYMTEKLGYMEYIDIEPLLTLSDYYRTDSHWKQESIDDVAQALAQAMGSQVLSYYEYHSADSPFKGVYAGQLALGIEPDRISYASSAMIDNCIVTSYDTGKAVSVPFYDFAALEGRDAYEFFLNGADALLVIENPNAKSDRELVIFRDSFTSSLAPLLLETYSKITLVDTRYVQTAMLGHFLDFTNQDVLFIYSTGLLNNSLALK